MKLLHYRLKLLTLLVWRRFRPLLGCCNRHARHFLKGSLVYGRWNLDPRALPRDWRKLDCISKGSANRLTQRSPREKVQALEEALDILRGLWSTSGFSYTGQHFRTEGATLEPKPGHPIPLWLGVFGDQMLDLAGRKADGWLPTYQFLEPEQAYQKEERIRAVAEHARRNPDEITYGYNVPILVEEGAVTNRWRIAGSARKVARQLAAMVQHGFTFVNVWPVGEAAIQRERLAREVLPAVRDLLA